MRSYMRGKTLWPPAPSTKDASHSGNFCGDPAASERDSGAAVSGSAAQSLMSGFKAFTALPTPVIRPPPPTPQITAAASGAVLEDLQAHMVAWPAMKASSSKGWMKVPSTPG